MNVGHRNDCASINTRGAPFSAQQAQTPTFAAARHVTLLIVLRRFRSELVRLRSGILPNVAEDGRLPTRSGRRASARRSGRPVPPPGWKRRRSPRRLRRQRCWSPGRWSLCGARPSWVPCTDSSGSTSARGSRWTSASSGLGSIGEERRATALRQVDGCLLKGCTLLRQGQELAHDWSSTGGWCST